MPPSPYAELGKPSPSDQSLRPVQGPTSSFWCDSTLEKSSECSRFAETLLSQCCGEPMRKLPVSCCLDIHISTKQPLSIKLPFLFFMWALTCVCRHWNFFPEPLRAMNMPLRRVLLASNSAKCGEETIFCLTTNPAVKLYHPLKSGEEDLLKKKKKKTLKLSCVSPICFAHHDKQFSQHLALLTSLGKSLLCAEWSISFSRLSLKCRAVSKNIGYSDSFSWRPIFMIVLHGTTP